MRVFFKHNTQLDFPDYNLYHPKRNIVVYRLSWQGAAPYSKKGKMMKKKVITSYCFAAKWCGGGGGLKRGALYSAGEDKAS